MSEITVVPAQRADVRKIAQMLGRAFSDDPVMEWILPDPRSRSSALPYFFATLLRHHFLTGTGTEIATRNAAIGAAALWAPPGRWKQTPPSELMMLPTLIWALGRRLVAGREVTELMKSVHPDEPHWYLGVIGSDPPVRGTGLGQALMYSRLERCDAEHAPAYLESSKAENVPYYQRFGFKVTGEIALPNSGPTIWLMWRNPQ